MHESPLNDKVMLITGAAGNLGRALADQAGAAGARLVLVDIPPFTWDDSATDDRSSPPPLVLEADITQPRDTERVIQAAADHFGHLHVLINSAGIFRSGPIDEAPVEDWHASLAVNLTGPYLMCRSAVAHWRAVGSGGHLINIASIGARFGFPDLSAYCASKAGLAGFSRALAEEVRPSGIRVTVVSPHAMQPIPTDASPHDPRRRTQVDPATVARSIMVIASLPEGAVVDEISILPQGTSMTPRMIDSES